MAAFPHWPLLPSFPHWNASSWLTLSPRWILQDQPKSLLLPENSSPPLQKAIIAPSAEHLSNLMPMLHFSLFYFIFFSFFYLLCFLKVEMMLWVFVTHTASYFIRQIFFKYLVIREKSIERNSMEANESHECYYRYYEKNLWACNIFYIKLFSIFP